MIISKYPFIKGMQCHKALWMHYFSPENKTPISVEQKMLFEKGKEVGLLAQELYCGGVDLSEGGKIKGKMLFEKTRQALKTDRVVFYEAGFETKDGSMMFIADLFIRSERATKLIEVKSSTKIKESDHILDLAFQLFVLNKSDYSGPPAELYIAYLNKEYIRGKNLDLSELFILENVTKQVIEAQAEIERCVRQFEPVMKRESFPKMEISDACFKPYECEFFNYCWKDIPIQSVFNIGGIRKEKAFKMYADGIIELHQIPKDSKLNEKQWIEVESAINNTPAVNKVEIRIFLESLELDRQTFYLDFESMMPAIPRYIETRAYQQLCFQYSCLIQQDKGAEIIRKDFLAEPGNDPRFEFITRLLEDTEGTGNIIVYNKNFEITRLKELAELFPELEEQIQQRIDRIKDLMLPFAKRHYYHPLMKGSHSIKKVLSLLVPELSYDQLSINNGSMAMNKYETLHTLPTKEKMKIKRALEEYCYTDVLAMFKIIDALQCIVKK